MSFLNIEIKARCADPSVIRDYLLSNGADFRGLDIQTDTYFNVRNGRLKLREGNIENNLIYYERSDEAGPKHSHFHLLKIEDPGALKEILKTAIGVKVVVVKKREIYYINNVKFHIDEVPGLGTFAEIEAGNVSADLTQEQLQTQCRYYLQELGIDENDLIKSSYSDMILEKMEA